MFTVSLSSVDFEVFGIVQGVSFRKHTQDTATKYGLVGWVQNTRKGTVIGTVQGPEKNVEKMKTWLASKGSPKSQIIKCDFKNEHTIQSLEFSKFAAIWSTPKK